MSGVGDEAPSIPQSEGLPCRKNKDKATIAEYRKLPRLLLKGCRKKRQGQPGDHQQEAAKRAAESRRQRRARKKIIGMPTPKLPLRTKKTVAATEVSAAPAAI